MNTRICAREGCEESIEHRAPQARFCSKTCGARHRDGYAGQIADSRTCLLEECNELLNGRPSGTKYCSRSCSNKHFYVMNREETNLRSKKWREANPERTKEIHRKWRAENPGRVAEMHQAWIKKSPERRRVIMQGVRQRRRAREHGSGVFGVTPVQFQGRWDYYSGLCWMCGAVATAMDHVKPLAKGGAHIASNLRPACTPCNSSKHAKWFGVAELHRFIKPYPAHTDPSV